MGPGTADTKEPETTSACYNERALMQKNCNLTKVIFNEKISHIYIYINTVNQPAHGEGSSPEEIQQKAAAAEKSSSSGSWVGKREWDQRAVGHYLFVPLEQWWPSLVGSGNNSEDQHKRNEGKLQIHQR